MKAALQEATNGISKHNLNTLIESTYESFDQEYFQKIETLYRFKDTDDSAEETK